MPGGATRKDTPRRRHPSAMSGVESSSKNIFRVCRLGGGRADADPRQPVVARHHLSAHIRRETNKVAGAQRNLFSARPQDTPARDHRVHLFLIVADVIVLGPLRARSQLELIDPKASDAELIRQRTKDSVPRLYLTHVNQLIRTHHILLSAVSNIQAA